MKRVVVNTKVWDATGSSWDMRRRSIYSFMWEYDVRNGTKLYPAAMTIKNEIQSASELVGASRRKALRAAFKKINVDLRFVN